jgi:hypothetical protein
MATRTSKQKGKVAKRLAIATAVIALLIFVVKEILKENLKELHDSLASAESQFRNENGQTAISMQILLAEQQNQIQNLQLQAQARRNDAQFDYSTLIRQDTITVQQIQANADADFDSASRLIDKMPSGAQDLRQLRDQTRTLLEKTDQQVKDILKPTPAHDVWRLIGVKLAIALAAMRGLPVAVLGDRALTRAQQVQEATEKLIRLCSRIAYLLVFLGAALGLYAILTGSKTQAVE